MANTAHICIIDGHPDPADHLIHALCAAYASGAEEAGHTVEQIRIADLDIDFLATPEAFMTPPDKPVLSEREKIKRADHVVIAFPLWLGNMPAKTKAFFEQAARGNFFIEQGNNSHEWPRQLMKGRSARVIMTMGMPGLIYRFAMDAGALKALTRGILGISGFHPIENSIYGGVEAADDDRREKWFAEQREFGAKAV